MILCLHLKTNMKQRPKIQVAAFLAHIAQETTGGWDDAPGGRHLWGLNHTEEVRSLL